MLSIYCLSADLLEISCNYFCFLAAFCTKYFCAAVVFPPSCDTSLQMVLLYRLVWTAWKKGLLRCEEKMISCENSVEGWLRTQICCIEKKIANDPFSFPSFTVRILLTRQWPASGRLSEWRSLPAGLASCCTCGLWWLRWFLPTATLTELCCSRGRLC